MRTHHALLLLVAALLAATIAHAEQATVDSIRASSDAFLNEVVVVDGFITQYVPSQQRTSAYYLLRDDYGGVIRVITTGDRPLVGARYRIQGLVSRDPKDRKLVLIEQARVKLAQPEDVTAGVETPISGQELLMPEEERRPGEVTMPAPTAEETVERADTRTPAQWLWSQETLLPVLLGAIAVAGVILVALSAVMLMRSRQQRTEPSLPPAIPQPAQTQPPPKPAETIEGRTIKLHAPPAKTLKILPGRLEVLSGEDQVREIRFYKAPGMRVPEVTFGRASGAPYKHVQLKAMTVSAQQARLTYSNGHWTLTNLAKATSNPTRVNGRDLDVGEEVVLRGGDIIEMGEVSFRFHDEASQSTAMTA